jgi:hypothetical protein
MKRALLAILLSLPAATLAQQPQPAPELSLSVNGSTTTFYAGWPLIVNLTIMNSARHAQTGSSLVISPTTGQWTDAITFTVLNSSRQTVSWPFKLVGTAATSSLTLLPKSYVRAVWELSPADVSALAAGTYQIGASLQVSNPTGWNGSVQSSPLVITVGPEPTLTPDQQAQKTFRLSEYAINNNDIPTAVTITQQLRIAQPNNAMAAIVAANVLQDGGYSSLAFLQASDALNTYYTQNVNPAEAPSTILPLYQNLFTTFATPSSAATSTFASTSSVTFSPNNQTTALTSNVTVSGGAVNGGTVTFNVANIGSATSSPVTSGIATATLTIPGGTAAGQYPIQAFYNGAAGFQASSDTAGTDMLTIAKATPVITWNPPQSIPAGTPLDASVLNATASVPGTFYYNPPAGTVLSAGSQNLSVTFIPADSIDYGIANASVYLSVMAGTFSGQISPSTATISVGSSKDFNITIDSSNFVGDVALDCGQPPAGVTCKLSPAQVHLAANGNAATVLTVSVSAKPAGIAPVLPPWSRMNLPSPPSLLFWILLLVALGCGGLLSRRRSGIRSHSLASASLLIALVFLAVGLSGCSAYAPGSGGPQGGGSHSATVTITINGSSGSTTAKIATVIVSVP